MLKRTMRILVCVCILSTLLAACNSKPEVELGQEEQKVFDIEKKLASEGTLQAEVVGVLEIVGDAETNSFEIEGTLSYDLRDAPRVLFEGEIAYGEDTYSLVSFLGDNRYYEQVQSDTGEIIDSKDDKINLNKVKKAWMGFSDPQKCKGNAQHEQLESFDYYFMIPEDNKAYYQQQLSHLVLGIMVDFFELNYEVESVSTRYVLLEEDIERVITEAELKSGEETYRLQVRFDIDNMGENITVKSPQ